MTDAEKKARLELYLAKSQRLHRRARIAAILGIPVGIALLIAPIPGIFGGMFLALDVAVGGIGMWITFGHILDFQHQLRQLAGGDQSKKRPGL